MLIGSLLLSAYTGGFIVFWIMKMWWLVVAFFVLLSVGCFMIYFEIRDFRIYQSLSARMAGKTLEERLRILAHYEECWLVYATADEVRYFRDMAKVCLENKALEYLLERASVYGK